MNWIYFYVKNERSIYDQVTWLKNCVEKRMKKGQPVTHEHLANCSTMGKITYAAQKYAAKHGETYTKDDRKEAAQLTAKYIIDWAQNSVQNS